MLVMNREGMIRNIGKNIGDYLIWYADNLKNPQTLRRTEKLEKFLKLFHQQNIKRTLFNSYVSDDQTFMQQEHRI
jgi:hypothetical protein